MRYIAVDIPHYVIVLFICIAYSKPKLYSWLSPTRVYEL
nr:MAG TPA: hypothetical protein [Caudoviricetes sp.]